LTLVLRDETREDSPIGCIILESPFFLHERDWIPVPADYHHNLVQGKGYDATIGTGRELAEWATARLRSARVTEYVPPPMFGEPSLVRRRLGQGGFRVLVSDAYGRRCAVTGEKTFPVLEAAHIQPVSKGGEHRVSNGLLMRADIHKLFDLGYVTVSPTGQFRVSSQLREEWQNGVVYYALEKSSIRIPNAAELRPIARCSNGTAMRFSGHDKHRQHSRPDQFGSHFANWRDWSRFHDPKNLVMALSSEVGELSALLRWIENNESDSAVRGELRERFEAEVGDVAIVLLTLCARAEIDLGTAVVDKLLENDKHYPETLASGKPERPTA
jgi:NTP pyrophosphatase (non-canonical NTP hydrolase)